MTTRVRAKSSQPLNPHPIQEPVNERLAGTGLGIVSRSTSRVDSISIAAYRLLSIRFYRTRRLRFRVFVRNPTTSDRTLKDYDRLARARQPGPNSSHAATNLASTPGNSRHGKTCVDNRDACGRRPKLGRIGNFPIAITSDKPSAATQSGPNSPACLPHRRPRAGRQR